jgi:ATP synthase F1 gamma subunit
MNYLKAIIEQIENLTNIKDIMNASEEIASMHMRAIRNKVLLSRDLNDELTEIYREVTTSYTKQVHQLMTLQGKNNNPFKTISSHNNGKIACVYLSANSGFFSKILEKTYHEFIEYLNNHNAEPVIIGEFGKRLFMNDYPDKKFISYSFAEDETSETTIKQITKDLSEYDNVIIFYARFESMAQQNVQSLDVSGEKGGSENEKTTQPHYLFEPSLEKIIGFFENEIFAGIIHQAVTESELARYASRITTLDIAQENIKQKLKAIALEERIATHRIINKKQTEALAGISLWNCR